VWCAVHMFTPCCTVHAALFMPRRPRRRGEHRSCLEALRARSSSSGAALTPHYKAVTRPACYVCENTAHCAACACCVCAVGQPPRGAAEARRREAHSGAKTHAPASLDSTRRSPHTHTRSRTPSRAVRHRRLAWRSSPPHTHGRLAARSGSCVGNAAFTSNEMCPTQS